MKSQITIETDQPEKTLELVQAMQRYHSDTGKARMIIQVSTENSQVEQQLVMLFPRQAHIIRTVSAETKALPEPGPTADDYAALAEANGAKPKKKSNPLPKALRKAQSKPVSGQNFCSGCGAYLLTGSRGIRCPECLKKNRGQKRDCYEVNGLLYIKPVLMKYLAEGNFAAGQRIKAPNGTMRVVIKDPNGYQLQKV